MELLSRFRKPKTKSSKTFSSLIRQLPDRTPRGITSVLPRPDERDSSFASEGLLSPPASEISPVIA